MNIATYLLKEITWIVFIINCTLYLHIFTLKNNIMPPVGFKVQVISLNTKIPQKTSYIAGEFIVILVPHSLHVVKYHIRENIHGGKLMRFEWKIAICDKTFAVEFLQTYIAD